MYQVEVKAIGGWTTNSTHESYRDAVGQADMVHGRIVGDEAAWRWAAANQGYAGSYDVWHALEDSDREEYEDGAGRNDAR